MTYAGTANVGTLVSAAAELGIVVPAYNIPYLPMAEPVARTLARLQAFGMLQVARLEFTKFQARNLAAIADEYNRYADPRFARLHLDHVPVIDEDQLEVDWRSLMREAIELGYHSVMIDGSRLPLEENIAVTAEVVAMAHPHGIPVEAELGAVLGHEAGPLPPYEELFASKRGFTDPDEAREFVRRTGVDWLSVSAGSVHGAISQATKDQPKVQARLDIDHLRTLREAAGVPLVLHGGSGIPQNYIDEAIAAGIAKINIATDLRQPYERALGSGGTVYDAQKAVAKAVEHSIHTLRIEGSAPRIWAAASKRRT